MQQTMSKQPPLYEVLVVTSSAAVPDTSASTSAVDFTLVAGDSADFRMKILQSFDHAYASFPCLTSDLACPRTVLLCPVRWSQMKTGVEGNDEERSVALIFLSLAARSH